ncbi:bidirectional sugar transporter sweet17 [Quercus suber]|uniref:Bidirectional sugar transporter SWEET n=1 Tax=Quercus suber TaxID=58331 RepID=A0AAW0I509_QUESU
MEQDGSSPMTPIEKLTTSIGTFWRIIKDGSTEEFESLPYICTLLNSALWTYYGIIKPGALLVATINGFGVLVETIFVTLFLIYAPARSRAKTAILVGILDVGFLAAAVLVTQLALHGETRIDAIGFLCAGLNIIMYGSPLAAMRTVVTTKSVEYMPFFLSFFLFLNGGTWTIYALLVRDYFLLVSSSLYYMCPPPYLRFLLGTAQLVLYAIYRKPRRSENDSERLQEEWQHECLISSSCHDQSH